MAKSKLLENLCTQRKQNIFQQVCTKQETEDVLSNLKGTYWLVANLFYGSGLRLLECLKLRVKDIDFNYNQIVAGNSKAAFFESAAADGFSW